ncbi:hypothetical protein HJC23_006337 [Cyclotella cryptica]|uniref:F-box domain-containing protein n=1 Tax=Cyclotella cryptica TaxID=29204 RepID=A0ABD3Q657_9STRA|eukprot:CCRYP_008744-RB/>CCRYP_008744-RB protein AED:0.02 eAED:0.02 QI:505/1/1/1/1/1/2/786/471
MSSIISSVKRKLAFLGSFVMTKKSPREASMNDDSEQTRPVKRRRLEGSCTPMLRSDSAVDESPNLVLESLDDISSAGGVVLSHLKDHCGIATVNGTDEPSDLLRMLPPHVLSMCLAYISTRSDRFGLQTTCKLFRKLSNTNHMLVDIDLGGDWSSLTLFSHVVDDGNAFVEERLDNAGLVVPNNMDVRDDDDDQSDESEGGTMDRRYVLESMPTGLSHGILTESDTSTTACAKLMKFSAAGNMQATYMLAMILCYCLENVNEGLSLLRLAASHGDLRSTYSLAIILRDSRPSESNHCLSLAARCGYIPAWQEKLTPTEMRARFGDLDASKLSRYLDPPCLNRLLGRHYLECERVMKHQTSHCWNPLCGRWAYKATSSSRAERHRGLTREGDNRDSSSSGIHSSSSNKSFSIVSLLPLPANESIYQNHAMSPLGKIRKALQYQCHAVEGGMKVSRMKMCSSCRRGKTSHINA